MKFIITIALIVILLLFSGKIKQTYIKFTEINMCVDMGVCTEGLKIKNDEGILFEINKKNCIKYGYVWREKGKSCDLRSKK